MIISYFLPNFTKLAKMAFLMMLTLDRNESSTCISLICTRYFKIGSCTSGAEAVKCINHMQFLRSQFNPSTGTLKS